MLEKNKDYIEMRVSSTDFAFTQNEPVYLCVEGLVDATNGCFPGPGEDYILISKEKFEALQMENEQLKKKLTAIQTSYALNEFDPIPEFKELLKKLYSTDDAENLEWVLNHTCGGRGSVNGWIAVSLFWKQKYETLCKLSGFSSVEEVQEYLTNNVECDTLHEAISKLRDEVTYICEKLCSANSENNSWKATAECNSPKELRAKLNLLRDNIEEWKEETRSLKKEVSDYKEQIESLFKVIESWNKVTCCSTPEDAKDWVNELGEANGNLAQAVLSWQNVTGCSCPKDLSKKIVEWETVFTPHMSARDLCSAMSNAMESYKHKFAPWEEITGFSTPEKCSSYIDSLEKKLEDIKDLIEED